MAQKRNSLSMAIRSIAVVLACLLGLVCLQARAQQQEPFLLGVDVFMLGHTQMLHDQSVALVTNQTGKNAAGVSTIDLLYQHPRIELKAIWAPEHGVRGKVAAGEQVSDERDEKTGLPIYSLYGGKDHRPTPQMMAGIDTVVYDIQDVGSRAYTYIWHLAEVMAACGERGIDVMVLDRPNPLGGLVADGPLVEPAYKSFIALYPIPRVYGLTVGELARYLNKEHHLNCDLTVIPMMGYRRDMTWAQTGITWTPSSPNIPTPESAVAFAATGTIGTLGSLHIGIGTEWPFRIVGTGWLDAAKSAQILNTYQLPGVTFVPLRFTPDKGGMKGQEVQALGLQVDDPTRFLPTTTEIVILHHLTRYYPNHFKWPTDPKVQSSFDKAMGTATVRQSLMRGVEPQAIRDTWKQELDAFRERRKPYQIYR